MEYRTFGRLSWRPSALGFGAMRLPVLKDETGRRRPGQIDHDAATAMLRYAVDHGVNYVDTAYLYHEGHSEPWLREALSDGYAEKVKVATKMPFWQVKTAADLDRIFDEQRRRLGRESFDFYLLHGLDEKIWAMAQAVNVLDWCDRVLADGRVRHLGFSFHGDAALFEELLAIYDGWTFCQIQYNYMDEEADPGRRGLRLAAQKDLAVVVMEPLRGGQLTKQPPPQVLSLWAQSDVARTPAEWALQWIWDQPEVSVVLSGMSTMEQTVENVAAAERSGRARLSAAERELVARVREAYRGLAPIDCTQCRYCQPCPAGVDIPRCFEIFNDAHIYGEMDLARLYYGWIDEGARARACTDCGSCEELCPQKLPIRDWLKKVDELLG
jgi:predicted aldo/keto reductase-like oxidoreductase